MNVLEASTDPHRRTPTLVLAHAPPSTVPPRPWPPLSTNAKRLEFEKQQAHKESAAQRSARKREKLHRTRSVNDVSTSPAVRAKDGSGPKRSSWGTRKTSWKRFGKSGVRRHVRSQLSPDALSDSASPPQAAGHASHALCPSNDEEDDEPVSPTSPTSPTSPRPESQSMPLRRSTMPSLKIARGKTSTRVGNGGPVHDGSGDGPGPGGGAGGRVGGGGEGEGGDKGLGGAMPGHALTLRERRSAAADWDGKKAAKRAEEEEKARVKAERSRILAEQKAAKAAAKAAAKTAKLSKKVPTDPPPDATKTTATTTTTRRLPPAPVLTRTHTRTPVL